MPIPSRPWESVGMDFVGPFTEVEGFDYVLLVICRLTAMVHLLPMWTNASAKDIAGIFVKEVVRLHGIPESIVSDRDTKFTSQFWVELSKILGQRLLMSSSYHPQMDGSSERAIQTMSQILRSLVNDYQDNWRSQLPMVEFAMNSAVSESTGYSPFESNYRWMPRMIQGIEYGASHTRVKQFIENIKDVLNKTFDKLTAQCMHQAVMANKQCREGQAFQKGDLVLLSTENINLPKGRARKLCPKYLGPYKVLENFPDRSTYKIDLLPDLKARCIHDVFHERVLKPFVDNDSTKFPRRETRVRYDIGNDPEQEWVIRTIEDHRWSPRLAFKVHWELGDSTWEPLEVVEELEALDQYLELEGVSMPSDLRCK